MSEESKRIQNALKTIQCYGGIDGGHHKQWVLDQVVRKLTGKNYHQWIKDQKNGDEGPDTYLWDVGVPP